MKYFQTREYKYIDQPLRCISRFLCNHLRLWSHSLDSGTASHFIFCLLVLAFCVFSFHLSGLPDTWGPIYHPYFCREARLLSFICCATPKTAHNIRRVLAVLFSSILSLFVMFISNHTEALNFSLVYFCSIILIFILFNPSICPFLLLHKYFKSESI